MAAAIDLSIPARRVATVVSTVAIGALTAATLWGTASAGRLGLDVPVAVLSFLVVPVTVRWPVGGGLAAAGLAVLSPVGTPAATFAALHAARRRRFPVAAAVAAAGIAAHAAQGWWRPLPSLPYGWWLLLMTLAYLALLGWGTWARVRQALLESLRDRARRAEAEQGRRVFEARAAERLQIAREMHDVLAHRLSLLAAYAGAVEYRPDAPPERLASAAGVIRAGAHQALEELREVITVLRQDPADDDSNRPPGPGLADLPRLIDESRAAGVAVDVDDRTSPDAEVPPAIGRTAYRVVQEALTNARKHAAGQPVRLTLAGAPGERLTVAVSNPVAQDHAVLPGAGTGLVGLTERVGLAGGRLDHQLSAEGEFQLQAWLPWPA